MSADSRIFARLATLALLLAGTLIATSSCRQLDCVDKSDEEDRQLSKLVNIEFIDGYTRISKIDNQNRITSIKTIARIEAFKLLGDSVEYVRVIETDKSNVQFVYENIDDYEKIGRFEHEIPRSKIKRITNMSDPLVDPEEIVLDPGDPEGCCCPRDRECLRNSLGFVDKIEARLLAGYQFGMGDGVYYPDPDGGKFYEKETIGFERGGSDFVFSLELAALWKANWLMSWLDMNPRDNFHIGFMTGVMPLNGLTYIPLTFHPRYTFNDVADNIYPCHCDTWYIFGDFGTAFDAGFSAPIFCENGGCDGKTTLMYGIGVGRDWWIYECSDISLDVGIRQMNLPLPDYECCGDDGYPYRETTMLFLRFGYTW